MLQRRNAETEFKKLDATHPIVAVVGPRQAGKTTFLKEQMAKQRPATYTTLDDISAKALFDESPEKFALQHLDREKVNIIDEVQYGQNAGIKLKHWADFGYKLWISASSQSLLESGVLSFLAGRVGIQTLYGFSLEETLAAANLKAYTSDQLEQAVWRHAAFGSYPRAVLTEDPEEKKLILKNLFTTVLLKDVFASFGIQNQNTLERLARFLAANMASELKYDTAASHLSASVPTVRKYVDALEKSFLVKRCPPFYTNRNLELVKQPKLYFIDTGMRNAVLDDYPASLENNAGLYENYLFSEITKAGHHVHYWKSKGQAEVDFVIRVHGKPVPIEAKTFAPVSVPRSLASFIERYAPKEAFIACHLGKEATLSAHGVPVHVMRTDRFLKRMHAA